MSLILCRQEPAKHTYYFEGLGVHLYSSQEICYVIYNNPLLVLDGFVDDHLLDFMRDELDMGFLAMKLEKWRQSGEDPDELLFLILQECDYYNPAEISRFRQQIAAYRKMSAAEFAKAKADYLFSRKQYGKAVAEYGKILEMPPKTEGVDNEFLARIYNNLGASYARLFMTDKAFQAYVKSFDLVKSSEVLKRLCYLMKWNPALAAKDRIQSLISEDVKAECDRNMEQAEKDAEHAECIAELDELFMKDPIRRLAGAGEMVQKWKGEYRSMV